MGEKNTRGREVRFTQRALEALKPPPTGRRYVYDIGQEGLAVCITPTGSKTFYRIGRVRGRPVRVRLGKFPDMNVDEARKATRAVSGDVARGVTVSVKTTRITLWDLFHHWLAHAKQRKKTWRGDKWLFKRYMAMFKNRTLADITMADVAKWHAKMGENHGPYQANRARALLSAMFNVAHEIGYDGPNPCQHVKRFREASRERFLRPEEMRPFFEALKDEPPLWRDFWLTCLFTGARRGNVVNMAWADVDLEQGVWYLAGSQVKNGKPLAVVLPPQAVAILQTRADKRNGAPEVFPYIKDPRNSWRRVLTRAGITDLRPHDLRRSLGSWQANAGVSLQVIGASLGHTDPKSTVVYSRLQLGPVRTAVNGAVEAMVEAGNAVSDTTHSPRSGNGERELATEPCQ